jgi:endonuclease/exonuclease/phosphatase (EEP) superfamily protein YafD
LDAPDVPSPLRRRLARSAARIGGRVALGIATAVVLAHWLPVHLSLVAAAAAAAPLAVLPLALAGASAASLRSSRTAIASAAVGLVLIVSQLPMYVGSRDRSGDVALTVMSVNMKFGQADAVSIVRQVRDHSVDVLAVQELTPAAARALQAAGLEKYLPNSESAPRKEAQGTGLWTRFALKDAQVVPNFTFAQITANATLDNGRTVALWAVHPIAPVPGSAGAWAQQLGWIGDAAAAHAGDSTIIAGDFNSSIDHPEFRALLAHGLKDAARSTNAGWMPTFPANWSLPPVVQLDHVLYRGEPRALSIHSIRIPGTDHLAVMATFAL